MTYRSISAFPPLRGRAHEVCGPGAFVFAFISAACIGGQIMWVRESWRPDQINPNGFEVFFHPDEFLLCSAREQKEVLAVAEEVLRSGAVALVVMELSKSLSLTEGRRLQLAARDGNSTGLAIIPEGMGSNAAETRWHCTPAFDPSDSTLHRWELIKNKSGTCGAWYVQWDRASRRVIVVSPAGKRPGLEGVPD